MPYVAPSISSQGLLIPAYADILSDLLTKFQGIYGQNVYLGIDSPDYQLLSVFSAKVSDCMQAVQLAYNARSPLTAVGADLDSLVKLNGLARLPAISSTCVVTLSGTAGSVITNGVVKDSNGYAWDLPASLTIGSGGTVNATATCETPGPIAAAANTLTVRATPTAGWTSVTNTAAAVVGTAIESDSALRARQSVSVALPSITTLAATQADIAGTAGVTRYNILENPTGAVDAYGNPAHSLTAVVEGGADLAVATAIYNKRGIGCFTNGTTSVVVTDSYTGSVFTVNFYRPTYEPITVVMSVHALAGYTTATTTLIQAAVANYLNTLSIGESVTISALYGAALAVMPNLSLPLFSIRSMTAAIGGAAQGTADIAIAFNQVASGLAANVTVNQV